MIPYGIPTIGQKCVGKRGGSRATVTLLRGEPEHPYAFEIRLESGEVASLPIADWGTRWVPAEPAEGGE